MVKMVLGSSDSQASSVAALADHYTAAFEDLIGAFDTLANEDKLSGRAYTNVKNYGSSVVAPLAKAFILLAEATKADVQKLPDEYRVQVGSEDLDEDILIAQIDTYEVLIEANQFSADSLGKMEPKTDAVQSVITSLNDAVASDIAAKAVLEEKLRKLREYDAQSSGFFNDIAALESAVTTGISQLQAGVTSFNGTFTLPSKRDLAWTKTINSQWETRQKQFEAAYGVRRPKGMSEATYNRCLMILRKQVIVLEAEGWNKKAIKDGYVAAVLKAYDGQSAVSIEQRLEAAHQEAHTVGSGLFTRMLKAAYKDTQEGQSKTLNLLYRVLGAEVDSNGFLQLTNMKLTAGDAQGTYQFTQDMTAALAFDDSFSAIVQGSYPTGLPTKAKEGTPAFLLAQKTHQFRYYLDKKNNDALRATYPDYANDLERLKAYNAEHSDNKFKGEKARLHNKYQGEPEDYQKHIDQYGENFKYVSSRDGFHTEYIVDKNGNLVSQWNAYEIDENGIVNSDPNKQYTKEEQIQLVDGNSVNFAESAGGWDHHNELDSNPVSKYDPEVRKKIGKEWESPQADSPKRSDYFDVDDSESNANERLGGNQ